MLISSK